MRYYLLLCISLMFCSCSKSPDNSPAAFLLERDICTVIENGYINVSILSGNGNYSISVADPNIVKAEYKESENAIVIRAIKEGETNVMVKDNVSSETLQIRVFVKKDNAYLSLKVSDRFSYAFDNTNAKMYDIMADIDDTYFISEGHYIFLLRKTNTIYIFASEEDIKKGAYYIKSTYQFTDNGLSGYIEFAHNNITHRLDSKGYHYPYLINYMVNGYVLQETLNGPILIQFTEDFTDIYKPDFPSLDRALAITNCHYLRRNFVVLPAELL